MSVAQQQTMLNHTQPPQALSWLGPPLAVVGVIVLAVQIWAYGAWLLTSGLEPVRSAGTVPDEILANIHAGQTLSVVSTFLWLSYVCWDVFLRRSLTWSLLWTVTWAAVFWQEPLVNIRNHTFSFNTAFANAGDWTTYIPFVPDSYSPLPEPLLMEPLIFVYQLPLLAMLVCGYMRLLQRHLGITNAVALTLIAYLTVVAFDAFSELQGIEQQLLRYVEIGGPAIRAGQPDQWPLYEGFGLGAAWAFPGILMFWLRQRPNSDNPLWWRGRFSRWLTVLTAIGAVNLFFGAYNTGFILVMDGTVSEQPAYLSPDQRL